MVFSANIPAVRAANYGVATGNTAAVNTAALNAAIAATAGGGVVWLPRGVINLNAFAVSGNNVRLVGQGSFGGTTLNFNNATGDCITFGLGGHGSVEHCYITATTIKRTSGYAIKFQGGHFKPTVRDVRIDYHYNGIWMSDSAEGVIDHVLCRYMLGTADIVAMGTVGGGVYGLRIDHLSADNPYPGDGNGTRRTWAPSTAFALHNIVVTNGNIYQCTTAGTSAATGPSGIPGTTGPGAFTTAIVDGTAQWKFVASASLASILVDSYAYSVSIERSSLICGAYGIVMQDSANTGSSYPQWVYSWDMECDHNYFGGAQLTGGLGFHADSPWIGSCLAGNGVSVGPAFKGDVQLSHPDIRGNWQHGILWQAGPVNLNVQGGQIAQNSQQSAGAYHNITLANGATDVIISGVAAGKAASGTGQAGYGIFGGSGLSRVVITNCILNGNLTGGTNLSTVGPITVANNQ